MMHITPIQIRFKDVDKMGHVNNANHFTYFELARVHYMNDVLGEKLDWSKQGIILAKITVDYKHPILLDDTIEVHTSVTRFGNKSFEMSSVIVNTSNLMPIDVCHANVVLVCYDYTTNKTIPVPESWKEKVFNYQKEKC